MTTTPSTRIDTRDMLVVHDAIRREYGLAPAEVRGVAPADTARAGVLAAHIDLLNGLLHHHHAGEDRLLWPVLQPRVPAEIAPTVERMERQHEGIADAQQEVEATLVRWRATAEEQHILPLAA
ncbi:Hemerythrin HHE cation binding domain-containing protein [Modestobacter sp. DSM 44400]|uniref:hemerythrin domain-containing protein n=1 Tax=Modestobacter sp. DSM 44400 TaxID=1550230 RepID=UPI000897273D|nr:hemerythrin domain-containing protein [Modestobacter sp. DSM 44400]SDY56481.1 Hemerythrin HHE cation binding domain-containing protein [Modestobacter sp. DSM 44400]